jgi:dTMP kinase
MTPSNARAFFITLEGPEGSGKSTHAPRLAEFLRSKGRDVLLTREPGGTAIGDQIRSILNDHANAEMHPRAEILLFCASRAQLVNRMIRPQLARGGTVVCDRYSDSTLAYQGYGHGLNLGILRSISHFATDQLDALEVEFHRRVRQGYLDLAREEPGRWTVIDAEKNEDGVWSQILKAVSARLESLG